MMILSCCYRLFIERLCPDGLVFNDYDIEVEKCDLPYNIDCSKRPNLRKWNHKPKKFDIDWNL